MAVITDMGLFRFDETTREMTLTSLHPGCTVEGVQEKIAWPLKLAADLTTTEPPTAEELRIMREELDPAGKLRK